jgi:hypothetical protein
VEASDILEGVDSMRLSFSPANTESDVELFFVQHLLVDSPYLGIPETAVRSKDSLAAFHIEKGRFRKRYVPDFVVYCDGIPVLVLETKNPEEALDEGFAEAQLYAVELNKQFPADIHPAKWVIATNGRELVCGKWDVGLPSFRVQVDKLLPGTKPLDNLRSLVSWDELQQIAAAVAVQIVPKSWFLPSEYLGENTVTLAKAGHNSLYVELDPILRRYFNPRDKEFEDEIIQHAYVSSDETTKYERTFEDFLRTRVIPTADELGEEIITTKKSSPNFGRKLERLSGRNQPFMQLIIGGVGSGKTSFLKRYFNYTIDPALKDRDLYTCVTHSRM